MKDGRPLRILHCLWHGEIGGAERAVYQLVREQLRDPRLAPGLAFGQGGGLYWEAARELGCPVLTFGLRSDRELTRIPAMMRRMREFDVHHFHSANVSILCASALVPGARRVYTHRGGSRRYSSRKRLRYRLVGWLLRHRFHALSGNTAHAARSAERLFGLPAGRIRTTYNGLDFELLVPKRDRADVRRQLGGADEGTILIGTAANLRDWKRVDWLIAAAAQMQSGDWRIIVIGDGPDRASLESLARATDPGGRIQFVGRQANVADWLSALDVFVLPSSESESFGNAAVEAMALGLPSVVMRDGGGLLEHVEHNVTGLVAADVSELAHLITRLVESRADRVRLGAAGMRHVRSTYTLESMTREYHELYRTAGIALSGDTQFPPGIRVS